MKVLAIVLGGMIMLAGLPVSVHAEAVVEAQVVKAVPVGNTVCPVSGAKITSGSAMAPATFEYKGKIYNLCCGGCIGAFKADPEKYSKIADDEAAAQKAK